MQGMNKTQHKRLQSLLREGLLLGKFSGLVEPLLLARVSAQNPKVDCCHAHGFVLGVGEGQGRYSECIRVISDFNVSV